MEFTKFTVLKQVSEFEWRKLKLKSKSRDCANEIGKKVMSANIKQYDGASSETNCKASCRCHTIRWSTCDRTDLRRIMAEQIAFLGRETSVPGMC
jgi:hypothetical protein